MTDGHTRAVAVMLASWDSIPVTWDDDPLDMLAYALCAKWCDEEEINNVYDLTKRIVPHNEYIQLWYKRYHYINVPKSMDDTI